MIGVVFQFASEVIEVRVDKANILFRTVSTNGGFATIDNLKLDHQGVLKEHPDLKGNKEWRKETIKRFKNKIKEMPSEAESINYIIEDLTKYGYKAQYVQRAGYRPIKLNNG